MGPAHRVHSEPETQLADGTSPRPVGKSPSPLGMGSLTRELYLIALAREPSASEMIDAVTHLGTSTDRRQAVEDLGWVLINSKEFLFRH